jgi:hypothetical protein
MVGTTPTTCRERPAGPMSTCSVPCSPATRPTPQPWTSARIGPPGPRRRRRRDAGQAAALATVNPRASQPRPTPHHPSRPARCRQATAPPTDHGHVDPRRPTGAAHHTEPLRGPARPGQRGGSAADTGGLSVRRPGRTGRLDTGRVDVRSTGWTDVPTAGPDEADRATTGWPMSGHPRDRRHPLGGPTFARVRAPGGARPPRTAPRGRHLRRGPDRRRHWTAAQHHSA